MTANTITTNKVSIDIRSTITVKDPGSALTHFIGFVAALTSGPFLVNHYIERGASGLAIFGAIVFVLGMCLLYGASTTYHTVMLDEVQTKKFKKLDHMMIFILIAGSYTPICLTILKDSCGYLLLGIIWGLAVVGMIFKFLWVTCPKWVSSVIYVVMGWMCVIAFPYILKYMDRTGFYELLMGGIIYTVGGIIYAMKFEKLNHIHPNFGSHEIFHLFVLAGNALQFLTIYNHLV